MVLHPWGVVDRNVGNDCSFRHRMQLAQTEINKRFVSIASRLSRGLNRSFACQKGIPFFLVFCFCNYVSCILLGSFQALELFVLAAICRCARSSGWATSFQSRMHCIRRNSYFVVGPPPNPAFMRETSTGFM